MNNKKYKKLEEKASIELTKKFNSFIIFIILFICFLCAAYQYAKDNPSGQIATFFGIEKEADTITGDAINQSGLSYEY